MTAPQLGCGKSINANGGSDCHSQMLSDGLVASHRAQGRRRGRSVFLSFYRCSSSSSSLSSPLFLSHDFWSFLSNPPGSQPLSTAQTLVRSSQCPSFSYSIHPSLPLSASPPSHPLSIARFLYSSPPNFLSLSLSPSLMQACYLSPLSLVLSAKISPYLTPYLSSKVLNHHMKVVGIRKSALCIASLL